LLTRWQAAGHPIETIDPDGHEAEVNALRAADPWDEIKRAADWAAASLEADPSVRLAIVVPELEARRDEVESVLIDKLGGQFFMISGGRTLADIGIFGAAMTAIELLSGRAEFDVLSRWLRSPFFATTDASRVRDAAALEIAFRSEPRAQRGFVDAWRKWGLKARFQRLPDTADRLDKALDRLPKRATPTGWTGFWQSCLQILGWRGFELGLADNLRDAWDQAWATFSELTPIVGRQDFEAAFEIFTRIVSSQSVYIPMPLTGVHLMDRMTQIGPGYAGAWVCGFSDEVLPDSGRPNPLLPWAVQLEHGMPGTNPDLELAAAEEELERLRRRVPLLTFSCPARVRDQPLLPSPLVSGWTPAENQRFPGTGKRTTAERRIGARGWQHRPDAAPALGGTTIPGGTRTLDLQAKCPVKAFCISRLRAEPLEAPARGIDPRLRGILIHRVLERLLDPSDQAAGSGHLEECIQAAFAELVRPGDPGWNAQIRAERGRIKELLHRFIEREADRPAFSTIAVEQRADVIIEGFRIRCRIDRVDAVDPGRSGDRLLIDYKTGQSAGGRWFDARLTDCQLPIYAQQEADVAGIATIKLSGNRIEYRGAVREDLPLPARLNRFDASDWRNQVGKWREQITELLQEFASGDVRHRSDAGRFVRSDQSEHAGGAFAPLTRVGDLE
jgi:probable DNA repair protein